MLFVEREYRNSGQASKYRGQEVLFVFILNQAVPASRHVGGS